MTIDYTVRTDLKRMPNVHRINGRFFEQDSMANRIIVDITDTDCVDGAVMANIIRADGETITADGILEDGHIASVTLPAEAYAVAGKLQVFVKLTGDYGTVTLAAVEGNVYPSMTSEVM